MGRPQQVRKSFKRKKIKCSPEYLGKYGVFSPFARFWHCHCWRCDTGQGRPKNLGIPITTSIKTCNESIAKVSGSGVFFVSVPKMWLFIMCLEREQREGKDDYLRSQIPRSMLFCKFEAFLWFNFFLRLGYCRLFMELLLLTMPLHTRLQKRYKQPWTMWQVIHSFCIMALIIWFQSKLGQSRQ